VETNRPGFDTDDAANALFSIYFHCERDVVAQALTSMKRMDADVPRDVLPSRFQILPMPIAVETLRASDPHPDILKFAISILMRSLPEAPGDLSSTPVGVHILDLVESLRQKPAAGGAVARRLASRLDQEFKDILGPLQSGRNADTRSARAYRALWGKNLGKFQLKIGSYVTRQHG
jgi:hypothetical protein